MKMKKNFQKLQIVFMTLSFIFFSGNFSCSKRPPVVVPSYIEHPEYLQKNKGIPFQLSWFKEGTDWAQYQKIYITPIDTRQLTDLNYLETSYEALDISYNERKKEVESIANFMQQSLKKQFEGKRSPLEVVSYTDKETLVLELAITELFPQKTGERLVILDQAISWGEREKFVKGHIAMEGRVRDGFTQEVLGEFVDREQMNYRVLRGPEQFTRFGFAKRSIHEWSKQFVALAEMGHQETGVNQISSSQIPKETVVGW